MAVKPVSRLTDVHICPLHSSNAIITGSETHMVNNLPVARVGDTTACGATIETGVFTVFSKNEMCAHIGSLTSHGGVILTGSFDTFVDDGVAEGSSIDAGYQETIDVLKNQILMFYEENSLENQEEPFVDYLGVMPE